MKISSESDFKHISYVGVYFQPGSAGNFFSRSLSLCGPDWYYLELNTVDTEKKFNLISYRHAPNYKTWPQFEDIYGGNSRRELPEDSVNIYSMHLDCKTLFTSDIVGDDDRLITILIDPQEHMEFVIANAKKKDSVHPQNYPPNEIEDFKKANTVHHTVLLENIVKSESSLLGEIEQVAKLVNKKLTDKSQDYIIRLYREWLNTIPNNLI